MPIVVGISLRTAGKIYFFAPGENSYYRGEQVVVETMRGLELGVVKEPPYEVPEASIVPPLKPVIRRATAYDLRRNNDNRAREGAALQACRSIVDEMKLPMQLIDTQFNLDASHALIHFLADNRVDFRELVRELAHELHARIELRQVGVRDEAKLINGCGICGRGLCCSSFLSNFAPVSINMAKVQGLALNPQKISGACGRLMCCLAFENDMYNEIRTELPRVNSMVQTANGPGKVTRVNLLGRQVEVAREDEAPVWIPVDELKGGASAHKCCGAHKPVPVEVEVTETITETVIFEEGFYDEPGKIIIIDDFVTEMREKDAGNMPPETPGSPRPRRRRRRPSQSSAAPGASQPPAEQKPQGNPGSAGTPPGAPRNRPRRRR
ncbi:MAG: stage 0 sporulation family protein [bacterium]